MLYCVPSNVSPQERQIRPTKETTGREQTSQQNQSQTDNPPGKTAPYRSQYYNAKWYKTPPKPAIVQSENKPLPENSYYNITKAKNSLHSKSTVLVKPLVESKLTTDRATLTGHAHPVPPSLPPHLPSTIGQALILANSTSKPGSPTYRATLTANQSRQKCNTPTPYEK